MNNINEKEWSIKYLYSHIPTGPAGSVHWTKAVSFHSIVTIILIAVLTAVEAAGMTILKPRWLVAVFAEAASTE